MFWPLIRFFCARKWMINYHANKKIIGCLYTRAEISLENWARQKCGANEVIGMGISLSWKIHVRWHSSGWHSCLILKVLGFKSHSFHIESTYQNQSKLDFNLKMSINQFKNLFQVCSPLKNTFVSSFLKYIFQHMAQPPNFFWEDMQRIINSWL